MVAVDCVTDADDTSPRLNLHVQPRFADEMLVGRLVTVHRGCRH